MDDVVRMPLAEFLARFAPADDWYESWDDAVATLLDRGDDRSVAEWLRAELAAHGDFRAPVRVDLDEGFVMNGMHRVVAAILEESATIAFCAGDSPGTSYNVIVRATSSSKDIPATEDGEGLFTALRSFPVPDGWVTCDGLALHVRSSTTVEFGCTLHVEPTPDAELAMLTTWVRDRLSATMGLDVDAVEEDTDLEDLLGDDVVRDPA
jgi:hypothetical protein